MQPFLSIDQLEKVSQDTLFILDAKIEIQQKLEEFIARVEKLRLEYDRKGIAVGDTEAQGIYAQLESAIRHYRSQLQNDLPELGRRLLEARELHASNPEMYDTVDLIQAIIEERRREQDARAQDLQLSRQQAEKVEQDRHHKADHLLQRIAEQQTYYDASFLAIDVYHDRDHLKAIDRLDEVVDALLTRIQTLSDQPVHIYGSAIQKLKIMEAHARRLWSQMDPEPKALTKPRAIEPKSADEPSVNPHADLRGKVVIFGGHTTTRTHVKEQLPKVYFVWSTVEDGLTMADQAVQHIQTADMVILMTDDTSHTVTRKAMPELKKLNKKATKLHKEGVNAVVDAIALTLAFRSC